MFQSKIYNQRFISSYLLNECRTAKNRPLKFSPTCTSSSQIKDGKTPNKTITWKYHLQNSDVLSLDKLEFIARDNQAKDYLKSLMLIASGITVWSYINKRVACSEARSKEAKKLIDSADLLYENQDFEKLYELLIAEKECEDDEILWRLARSMYEKAKTTVDVKEKKKLYAQALEFLEKADKLNPNNFAVHKWLAIIMDCYYTLEGLKSRISHLYDMKNHMEKACELKPKDGTSWHVLGMWYFGVSNISWLERNAAAIFFATPPKASYEDALRMFQEAERVEPGFYSTNLLMIGKCLYYIGNKEEAVEYFQKAKNYDGKTADDVEAKTEAEKWLRQLGKA